MKPKKSHEWRIWLNVDDPSSSAHVAVQSTDLTVADCSRAVSITFGLYGSDNERETLLKMRDARREKIRRMQKALRLMRENIDIEYHRQLGVIAEYERKQREQPSNPAVSRR